MILFINTNLKDKVYFILSNKENEKTFYKEYACSFLNSQDILSFLEDFITFTNSSKESLIKDVDVIVIDNGPGINMNFRIGIIVLNSLAYLYDKNIIGILKNEYSDNIEKFISIGWEKYNKKEFTKLAIPEYTVK